MPPLSRFPSGRSTSPATVQRFEMTNRRGQPLSSQAAARNVSSRTRVPSRTSGTARIELPFARPRTQSRHVAARAGAARCAGSGRRYGRPTSGAASGFLSTYTKRFSPVMWVTGSKRSPCRSECGSGTACAREGGTELLDLQLAEGRGRLGCQGGDRCGGGSARVRRLAVWLRDTDAVRAEARPLREASV